MKIVYIVSSSYSGSTLLSFLLNSHPEVGTISEFDNMEMIANNPDYQCSCGQKIRSCQFFNNLKQRLNNRGIEFELDNMDMMLKLHNNERINRLLTGRFPKLQSTLIEKLRDQFVDMVPSFRFTKERYYIRNRAFMKEILNLWKASIFLDATKDPYRMLFLDKKFDTKVIYLFKNGIAGAYSYMKAARIRNTHLEITAAAVRWFEKQITISRALLRMRPEQSLMLSYSELCQDPPKALTRIYDFLDIDSSNITDQFPDTPHHILGNAMRLTNTAEIKEKIDWIDGLSKEEKNLYRKVYEQYIGKLLSLNPDIEKHIWY